VDDYDELSLKVKELGALPANALVDHFSLSHEDVDKTAPDIAPHLYATAANALNYLYSKLPPSAETFLQGPQSPQVSSVQKKEWMETYQLVNEPTSIFKNVDSSTLTSKQIQTLQSIYPDVYQQIATEMLEQLGGHKEESKQLDYSRRLTVSKFLGLPLDGTMTASSFEAIMRANSGATSQQAPKAAEFKAINESDQLDRTQDQARQIKKLKG
jgi:hypothetical protein